ncbi:ribonuclease HII [Novosphingobium sp. Gsoil 351]|nr:ribonuclease HII [Novosphingobium sp. Gsoil 351]
MFPPNARERSALPEPIVVGVDEAGRGPLAGPVVAAAVVLCRPRPGGLDDSKKLSREVRALLDERIRRRCIHGVGVAEVADIDRLNIFGATMLAMTLAVAALCQKLGAEPHEVLVDGNLTPHGRRPEWRWPARAIVGGDAIEPAISAASIVAKEHRDRLMRDYALAHPHYGWERNAGYGTPEHLRALRTHGATPLHRRSFAPVAQLEMFAANYPSPLVGDDSEACSVRS